MRKLTYLLAIIVLTSSCSKIAEHKENRRLIRQSELEQKFLQNADKHSRKDTLTFGFVLGWDREQYTEHLNNLESTYLNANEYHQYKATFYPQFKDEKLAGLDLFLEGDYLNVSGIMLYFVKEYSASLLCQNNAVVSHEWIYSGSNLKLDVYRKLNEKGVWVEIRDRLLIIN
ncbi:MAG: hypothetical protein JEY96_16890 [Bacteroidales bacterium]|nr:hypothetical protein [Bacteroidales bacterium]